MSLTNGKHLTVDKDNRPMLHVKGVVTVNHQGLWMPLCLNASTENSVIASSVCSVLGFQDYSGFYRYTVENASVDVTKSMTEGRVTLKEEAVKRCQHCCDGLFVRYVLNSFDFLATIYCASSIIPKVTYFEF